MADELNALRKAIREYVSKGGRIAFSFSMIHEPRFQDIPGKDIQRMIDEEVEKLKRKGRR